MRPLLDLLQLVVVVSCQSQDVVEDAVADVLERKHANAKGAQPRLREPQKTWSGCLKNVP